MTGRIPWMAAGALLVGALIGMPGSRRQRAMMTNC